MYSINIKKLIYDLWNYCGGREMSALFNLFNASCGNLSNSIILKEDFKIAWKVLCIIPAPQVEVTEVVPLDEESM